jgi:hypothetical protein
MTPVQDCAGLDDAPVDEATILGRLFLHGVILNGLQAVKDLARIGRCPARSRPSTKPRLVPMLARSFTRLKPGSG